MDLSNYFKIIIDGLSDKDNLKKYFIRKQKVNERDNYITKIEFYSKLENVLIDLKAKCEERKNKRMNELYSIIGFKKAKNVDTTKNEKEIDLLKPDMFPLNLLHLTNGEFRGFLSYANIEYVESIILEIIKDELNSKVTIKEPPSKEINKPDEVEKKLHNDIFKDNAFGVWQSMFDEFDIKESSYSIDLDFMFNVMQNQENKYLIHKAISKIRMLEWINEIHEITFTKIRYTNHKVSSNKNRLTIFNQITSK